MPTDLKPLVLADLRGGRNGVDPPLSLRDTECLEALNVDWYGATLGRKRGGADSFAMTGSTMTGTISTLLRHIPTPDETLAELWAVDDEATPVINRYKPASSSGSVDYLVVGGGGGGGTTIGGGGGGGLVSSGTDTLSPGSFPIVVGAGGASASNGSSSSFNSHTATGGTKGANSSGAGGASASGHAGGAAGGSITVSYLVGAGGGGGGGGTGVGCGGGGAGAVLTGSDTLAAGAYTIVVGTGGGSGASGNNSSFNSHTATGGGHGVAVGNGTAGGSGGGAGSSDVAGGSGGAGTTGGNNGGGAVPGNGAGVAGGGGGGGGAGGVGGGGNFPANGSGTGGAGVSSSITGSAVVYGSGGGGGAPGGQTAGVGGTGAGTGGTAAAGGNATGYCSGGGGAGDNATGGSGFQGIVIISYPGAQQATGGDSIFSSGGNTIHVFTNPAGGTFTVQAVGGGGGGDAAVGSGSTGGAGTSSSITGVPLKYAGGGGGGAGTGGTAGTGTDGGGNGSTGTGGTGAANTGAGGGGGATGGAGGSGVVILSYDKTAFLATGGSITTTSTKTIHTFTSSDTFIIVSAGAAGFTAPTLKDAPTGNGWDVQGASLNGKLFLAYKSAQDRLHVWDGSTVRRTGLASAAAPTAANGGSGSYAATLRYYRVRFTEQQSSVTVRRSEATPSVSFTPSGSGANATVTQPTPPGEGETHWEIEGSVDNATFYLLSTVAIGTTTYADTAAVTTYVNNTLSAATGTYTLPKSYKFIAADQNRLLGFGSWTSTDKQNRIEISAVVGSLNVGDAERVDTTASSYIDLDENDSGAPRGLIGPVNGNFYAFKDRQVWQLTPSGQPINPYTQRAISKRIGAVSPKAMAVAEDENGQPAVYWMSQRGPYRYGQGGLQYLGHGVEDLLLRGAPNSKSIMNLTAQHVICHVEYHEDIRQVWFYVATGVNNDPDTKLVYCIGRYGGPSQSDELIASGWAKHTGPSASARCAVLFSRIAGISMSIDRKPYIGYTGATNTIYVTDSTTTTDAGTAFAASVTSKAYAPWGLGNNGTLGTTTLLAQSAYGVVIQQDLIGNFATDGEDVRSTQIGLTPTGTETRVFPMIEDAAHQEVYVFQVRLGDPFAVASAWSLEALSMGWKMQEPR